MQYPDQAAVLNERYMDMQAAMKTGGVRDKVFYNWTMGLLAVRELLETQQLENRR
ncbi:hypothetical protein PSTG_14740 [Puccinia striiformis f. sp. tritici PST-78]|uniref:Uncharacterized protein n=1 Tax=Puccinia striiformis f. sp. tritici PST-78 TaxID=1165861 RepID=A0A0L0UYJ9_9BASI|nr:hypothetical protein PSTG_14740 [Puccinia striiformis f. sp. tritici PST-78]